MRQEGLVFLALACAPPILIAQPQLQFDGITNAASYLDQRLPNGGIAQGAMFVVKGRNLGACGSQVAGTFPLRTEMSGKRVRVTVGNTAVDALMVYVVACRGQNLPDQLAAILPSSAPAGRGSLTVTYSGRTSLPGKIIVQHDGHHEQLGAGRHYTIEAVKRLIPLLRAQGYEFGALCEAPDPANRPAPARGPETPFALP